MPVAGSLLSPAKRPKWRFITMGVGLIVVAVALTVAWQILAAPDQQVGRELAGLRWVAYFFGSLLFLLLIGGPGFIAILPPPRARPQSTQAHLRDAGSPQPAAPPGTR